MNQKALEAAIRLTLLECLPPGWKTPIIAGNQPTGQGRQNGVYFFRISEGKRGWLSRKYRNQGDDLLLTERQWNEPLYQFSALIDDDPRDDAQLLAGDVLDIVRSTVSSIVMVEKLRPLRIGVQRPSDIMTPAFVNDRNQYDFNPNFTVAFSHPRDITQAVPYTDTVEFSGIHRV